MSSPPNLVGLPNELLSNIVKRLNKKTISKLRLTCRYLSAIGAAYLVEQIHMMHLPKSWENLLNIAEHPFLRKYVKRVHCETRTFLPLCFEEWKNYIRIPDDDDNQEKLVAGWAEYQKLTAGLEKYQKEGKNLDCLQIMCRFPNLKEITLPSSVLMPVSVLMWATFRPTLIKPYYSPQDVVSEAQNLKTILLTLSALSGKNTKLETFVADLFHWAVLDESQSPSPTLEFAFTSLKCLKLKFTRPPSGLNSTPGSKSYNVSILGALIRNIHGLESLTLDFDGELRGEYSADHETWIPYKALMWDELAQDKTWLCLKSLKLGAVDMSEDHIVDFMQRHASTLETLRLSDALLVQGDWSSTFRHFKKALNLKNAKFGGVFHVATASDDDKEFEFDPSIHLPMSDTVWGKFLDLKGKHRLGTNLIHYLLKEEEDEDPLKEWGHKKLPRGVKIVESDHWYSEDETSGETDDEELLYGPPPGVAEESDDDGMNYRMAKMAESEDTEGTDEFQVAAMEDSDEADFHKNYRVVAVIDSDEEEMEPSDDEEMEPSDEEEIDSDEEEDLEI